MKFGLFFANAGPFSIPDTFEALCRNADETGFESLWTVEHVVVPVGYESPYPYSPTGKMPGPENSPISDPLVALGYAAALTKRIRLATGIVILPQRQAALVAKQAAEVAVLSEGRFRLGIGVGWNAVEYEALGESFRNRGRRVEEQIALMRALWGESVISFEGEFHSVVKAGINPRPPGGNIPLWIGGMSDVVQDRVGRLADGWFPQYRDPADLAAGLERVHTAAEAAGRDPASIGIEGRVSVAAEGVEAAAELGHRWVEAGATHVSVNTMDAGYSTPGEHIAAIEAFKQAFA